MDRVNIWQKRSSKNSNRSRSFSSRDPSSSDSNSQATTGRDNDTLCRAIHIASAVPLAITGVSIPSRLQHPHPISPSHATSARNPSTSADNDQLIPGVETSHPGERTSAWKTTAKGAAKMALDVAKESSSACSILQSAVGGLVALLKHYDVSVILPKKKVNFD
jgi:hypothetical protein